MNYMKAQGLSKSLAEFPAAYREEFHRYLFPSHLWKETSTSMKEVDVKKSKRSTKKTGTRTRLMNPWESKRNKQKGKASLKAATGKRPMKDMTKASTAIG